MSWDCSTTVARLIRVHTAFLAASSCLGDGFRARVAGVTVNLDLRRVVFDRGYLRGFTSVGGGSAGGSWDQIELDEMLDDGLQREDF